MGKMITYTIGVIFQCQLRSLDVTNKINIITVFELWFNHPDPHNPQLLLDYPNNFNAKVQCNKQTNKNKSRTIA